MWSLYICNLPINHKFVGSIPNKMLRNFSLFLIIICYAAGLDSHAQNIDSLLQHKRKYVTGSIGDNPVPKIDGFLDDAVWELGEWQGDFSQQQPVVGAKGSEDTYLKVLYDRSNLYVAIICQEDDPDLIRDMFASRDAFAGDMTGIAIDSYFDKRTAFEFNLSAAGQKMDLKHLGDYEWDFNWNGVWDGASARNDSGWVAEMRIPFSQMRYTDKERHIWGMHVWRWISRNYEEDQWQLIPREAPAMVYLFGELHGVENIRSSRQVEFLPYASTSLKRPEGTSGPGTFMPNAGVDAKVGISSDYTLDLSINPDFGQVEADPSVLNLTTFETFYEEKRPFFMEGNEIFDFKLCDDISYYSRRIGSAPSFPGSYEDSDISDIPTHTTILGAAKLTGKSSKGLSVGLINGFTAEEYGVARDTAGNERDIQVAPLSNYLASRIKKEYKEGTTIVGGMFSLVNRISADEAVRTLKPSSAVTGGVDLLHYWNNKNYYLEAKAIASRLQGSTESILLKQQSRTHRYQRAGADYLDVDSTAEQLSGHGGMVQVGKKGGTLLFNLTGEYRSPGLDLNDIGYIRQADFLGERAEVIYEMNDPGEWIRNYKIEISHQSRWSFGGENTMNSVGFFFNLMNNKLWQFMVMYDYDFSHLDIRELRGGPALRVDGEHQTGIQISSDLSKDFSGSVGFHYNTFAGLGSHQEMIHGGFRWLIGRKLRFTIRGMVNNQDYHQQYVRSIDNGTDPQYVVGKIDHRTTSLTFRGELFINPEMSIQYYGSPYYSVGDYSDFNRVDRPEERDPGHRLVPLDVTFDSEGNSYSFPYLSEQLSFDNPDFSFMEFRSNLVFRWEYKLGSTLYLVWAHDRSGWESLFNPISDITGDLIGLKGNNVFMFKMNFWFSV